MRRRFHLIPFTVTIPQEDRDPLLAEKLKAEWPGILQWMIDGARRWYAEGLQRPIAVEEATREYLETEDTLLTWIEERCECGHNLETSASSLFASWKTWTELTGEFTGTARAFGMKLVEHGFEKTPHGRRFLPRHWTFANSNICTLACAGMTLMTLHLIMYVYARA